MRSPRANLDRQLSSVRSRWIVRDAVLSLAWTVLAIVPVCLALGWLDYRLDFSRGVRVIELAGLVAWLVWTVRRFLVPAVGQRRDAYGTALRVESTYDQFGGRLVSRVEFRGGTPGGVSAELIDAMCARVERDAAGVPLSEAIDMKPVRRPAAGAAAALLMLGLVVLPQPGLAGLWIQRTLLPFSEAAWPRRTQIRKVNQQYRVRRGDSVRVTGVVEVVSGGIPRTGEVEWRSDDDARLMARPAGHTTFDVAADGAFAVTIGPLLESITLSIDAGDARLDDIPVEVVVPPELGSIEAVYCYPEFTGRQPDRVQSGDVRVLVGTRVDLTLTADLPTERMELAFADEDGERIEPAERVSQLEGRASFTVHARGRYQVRLFDANAFCTDSPATFVIDPIDNGLPTVRITRPGSEHTVTPATRLRLRFEAADDYGVTAASVQWGKRGQDESARGVRLAATPIPVPTPRTRWEGRYAWDLAAADLQSGEEIEYHIQVQDAGQHLTEEKTGISATQVLQVVDPESLRQSLQSRLREAFGELDHVTQQQSSGLDAVSLAIVSLPTGDDPLMPADVRRVQAEQHRQTRIRRQVGRLALRLAEIADELGDSFLADSSRIEELHALADGLRGLAGGPMAKAVVQLKQARAVLGKLSLSETEGAR